MSFALSILCILLVIIFKVRNKKRKNLKTYSKNIEEVVEFSDKVIGLTVLVISVGTFIIQILIYITYDAGEQSQMIRTVSCSTYSQLSTSLFLIASDQGNQTVQKILPKSTIESGKLQTLRGIENKGDTIVFDITDKSDKHDSPQYMYIENQTSFGYALVAEVKENGNYEANSLIDLQKQLHKDFENLAYGYAIGGHYCKNFFDTDNEEPEIPSIIKPSSGKRLYFVVMDTFEKYKSPEKRQAEEKEYKESSQTIPYKKLLKGSEEYIGTKVYYRGKVIQALSEGGMDFFRLEVTDKGYGYWDDVVGVISPKTDFIQDDIINVRGELKEDYCYESTVRSEICIPLIKAEYIE